MMPEEPTASADRRFPPERRIRRKKEYEAVFQKGRKCVRSFLVVFILPRDEKGPSRLGMAVSRKVGKAVTRNRVRRRLREIFRLHYHEIQAPHDIVVVARPDAATAQFSELESSYRSALKKLGLRLPSHQ